jgi:hypothetical protein
MVQRAARFSTLDIPANAIPFSASPELDPKLSAGSALRAVYTMEQNVWKIVCEGESAACYVPSKRWDGKLASRSVEDKPSNVTWSTIRQRLSDLLPSGTSPVDYVRHLFWSLRARRDLPPPSPVQLYAASYIEAGMLAKKHADKLIRVSFISQVKSLRAGTLIRHRGQGMSEVRSLHQTLICRDNGYTPLFVYSMAHTTTNSVRASDLRVGDTKYIELLDRLAQRTKIAAVLEYTVFPECYDATWGEVLAPGLSVSASTLLSDIVSSFAS